MRILYSLLMAGNVALAQTYHPAAGQPGTSAMHQDSSAFVAWATACSVTRGLQDISTPGVGYTTVGDNSMALGKSQSNGVVSLGDGGSATCTFAKPIKNGAGADFAVFENSIDDNFLELAFVEVSSDGVNFFRFASHSLTDTAVQTQPFGATDPKNINNLAGKYRAGYGTPFDLQELAGNSSLNVNEITHVRITDVVGSMQNAYAQRDSQGNKINDPWPTAFPSGGFDLDAVGVVHQSDVSGFNEMASEKRKLIFPNPAVIGETIYFAGEGKAEIFNVAGQSLGIFENEVRTGDLCPGVHFMHVQTPSGSYTQKFILLQR